MEPLEATASTLLCTMSVYMYLALRTYDGGGSVEAQSMEMLLPGCAGTVSAAGCTSSPHARFGSVVDVIGLVVAIWRMGLSIGTVMQGFGEHSHVVLVVAIGTYLAVALWVGCPGMTCRRSSRFAHSHARQQGLLARAGRIQSGGRVT